MSHLDSVIRQAQEIIPRIPLKNKPDLVNAIVGCTDLLWLWSYYSKYFEHVTSSDSSDDDETKVNELKYFATRAQPDQICEIYLNLKKMA